jgi:MATE family multidrug resistance protein
MGIFVLFDFICTTLAGIIRGLGLQLKAAIINIFVYYGISLPLCYVLAFKADLGLIGLWIGLPCGLFILGIAYILMIIKSNW